MTDKAKKRRRELANKLGVSTRTAANIIRSRAAERREGGANTASGGVPQVARPAPSVRHFYLAHETDYDVNVTVDMQKVAYFRMGGGSLTDEGTKDRKFGWFSTWEVTHVGPTRASWVVDEGSWGREWEPSKQELYDLAEKAMTDEVLHRFKYVLVIHAPNKLAMMASDRPLPHGDPMTAMAPVPRQPITEGPPPAWWPDGTKRPIVEEPPTPPSRPAKGAIYALSQIVQAAHRVLEKRPQTRIFTTAVGSRKDVDDRVGLNGEVARVPLVDVTFVEDRPSQWYFDGEIAFLDGDLDDGVNPVPAEVFGTKEGRDRLAQVIVDSMDPSLVSVLGHLSVRSGVQRGDNLILRVSLSVIDKQEEAFGELVLALEQAAARASLQMTRGAIATAREALARVQEAAETPRQKKLAKRALGHEVHWKRVEESLTRMEAFDRGVLLPIR